MGAASASGLGSLCVESQHDLAQLDAVAVGQLTLTIEVRQRLIIHYYRVGLRKIRDGPASIAVGEPRVLPAHRARLQSDMLRRTNRISAKDQLGQLARSPDESNLPMACLAGEHLEAAWQQLEHLFGGSLEADRFGRSWITGFAILTGFGFAGDACSLGRSDIGDERCPGHRHFGFEGLRLPRVL